MNQDSKIVVWVHHGLGDVIMALPMLAAIDAGCSAESTLVLLVKSNVEESFLRLLRWKASVVYVNLGHSGGWNYKTVLKLALNIRRMKPDVFLATHASNGVMPAVFSRLIGAPHAVGPSGRWSLLGFHRKVNTADGRHKVTYYSDFARLAGYMAVPDSFETIDFLPSGHTENFAAFTSKFNHPTVVIGPGSSPVETHKRWPPGHFRELIQLLLQRHPNLRILLIGSVSERSLLEEISDGLDSNRVGLLAQSSLAVLIGSMRSASVFVSACTGTAHLAALLSVPIVGIYGPTNPFVTGPWTKALRIVRTGYDCSPCYGKGYEMGCGNPRCMRDIQPTLVADAIFSTIVAK